MLRRSFVSSSTEGERSRVLLSVSMHSWMLLSRRLLSWLAMKGRFFIKSLLEEAVFLCGNFWKKSSDDIHLTILYSFLNPISIIPTIKEQFLCFFFFFTLLFIEKHSIFSIKIHLSKNNFLRPEKLQKRYTVFFP